GQMTPFERASLSLKLVSCVGCFLVAISPPCPTVAVTQLSGLFCSALGATGGLVCGGACANAGVVSAQAKPKRISRFIALLPSCPRDNGQAEPRVPVLNAGEADQREMA